LTVVPTWDELTIEYADRAKLVKIDCEIEQRLCMRFDIEDYPTVLMLKGREVVKMAGSKDESALRAFITDEVDRRKFPRYEIPPPLGLVAFFYKGIGIGFEGIANETLFIFQEFGLEHLSMTTRLIILISVLGSPALIFCSFLFLHLI